MKLAICVAVAGLLFWIEVNHILLRDVSNSKWKMSKHSGAVLIQGVSFVKVLYFVGCLFVSC